MSTDYDINGDTFSISKADLKQINTISVQDEVKANQAVLRSRLAGAISTLPANVSESDILGVPLIDLSQSYSSSLEERRYIAKQIHEACKTSGFFQISNHGVPEPSMQGILQQAERFFRDLTPSQKDALHIRHSQLFRGYESGGDTYVNPDDNDTSQATVSEAETKEGFNWGYEPALDLSDVPSSQKQGYVELDGTPPDSDPSRGRSNVWPDEHFNVLPGFKPTVAAYYTSVVSLARHLFRLFALALDLEETYFDSLTTHPGAIGRLLYYPPQSAESLAKKEQSAKFTLGLGAHTDYECFTLLLSSAHPGLEILFPPSQATGNKPIWRPCPIRPGTLTVNVADFLMRWTNGLYKSTIHRVVSRPIRETITDAASRQQKEVLKGSEPRYSVPIFISINYDADVEALPESVVGESKWQRLRAGEYVLERLRATV